MNWVNKDTEIYCSFAKKAGNTGCQMMNSAFYYHGLNKDGILKAYNTDFLAARKFLQNYDYKLYFSNTYVLGNGGYAAAVKTAIKHYGIEPIVITRDNWHIIENIKDSLIYNCSPVENLPIHESNKFINCIVTTKTGLKLATTQAAHQFKLYTGLKFPY